MRSPCWMLTLCSVTYVTYHDCIRNCVHCPCRLIHHWSCVMALTGVDRAQARSGLGRRLVDGRLATCHQHSGADVTIGQPLSAAASRGVGGKHSLHGGETLARKTCENLSSSGSLQRQSLGSIARSAVYDPSFRASWPRRRKLNWSSVTSVNLGMCWLAVFPVGGALVIAFREFSVFCLPLRTWTLIVASRILDYDNSLA